MLFFLISHKTVNVYKAQVLYWIIRYNINNIVQNQLRLCQKIDFCIDVLNKDEGSLNKKISGNDF